MAVGHVGMVCESDIQSMLRSSGIVGFMPRTVFMHVPVAMVRCRMRCLTIG